MLLFMPPFDVVVEHRPVVRERGHRLDKWHQHGLGFLLTNLDEAVTLELNLQRGGQFGQLLIDGVVLNAGELLEGPFCFRKSCNCSRHWSP